MSAGNVTLSTGYVQFSDPSLPWSPDDFPNLPSSMLSITASGSLATAEFTNLTIPNTRVYEDYEPEIVRQQLLKTANIDSNGNVTFQESRVGFVSTYTQSFQRPVTEFSQSTIGGTDILPNNGDTVTNAIAKLDAWIANAFLYQPPAVRPLIQDPSVFYGGVRWQLFNSYNIADRSVPYVNSILFIIGEPTSLNYITFELTNKKYFPYKQYTDGISPTCYPLVRLRIFTDFFLSTADEMYSKAAMQKCGGVRLITESGTLSFPDMGKVIAFEHTDGETSYTTVNLYLPSILAEYPKGTEVPVKIVYLNATEGTPEVAYASTVMTTFGTPSEPTGSWPLSGTASTLSMILTKPVWSDEQAQVSTAFFSSYNVKYTWQSMITANTFGQGFRYGEFVPNVYPSDLPSEYLTNLLVNPVPTCGQPSTTVVLEGAPGYPILPGMIYSTSATAVNKAYFEGIENSSAIVSTLFPSNTTQNISTTRLLNTDAATHPANNGLLKNIYYDDGWNIEHNISTDVFFLSTIAPMTYQLSTAVQFNDASYPGDRGPMQVDAVYTDEFGCNHTTVSQIITSISDDFTLNVPYFEFNDSGFLTTTLTDQFTTTAFQRYFYNANIGGLHIVSSFNHIDPQHLQVALCNAIVPNMDALSEPLQLSTATYSFLTEELYAPATNDIVYQNVVTSSVQVCGFYTPSLQSEFFFDIVGQNVAYHFAGPSFAAAQFIHDGNPASEFTEYTSSMHIFNTTFVGPSYSLDSEVTSIPFPADSDLLISSCTLKLNSNVYNDPNDPKQLILRGRITSMNPVFTSEFAAYNIDSNMFIDTRSASALANFSDPTGPNGLRLRNMLPRDDIVVWPWNMYDGVDSNGVTDVGLHTQFSTFFTIGSNYDISISSGIYYDNSSNLSTTTVDTYSRELLFTNGTYIHPAGFDFTAFDGTPLGYPDAHYGEFLYDLVYDHAFGYRYATFAIESPRFLEPSPYHYMDIRVQNASEISSIGQYREHNMHWPATPTTPNLTSSMQVRMHMMLVGTENTGTYQKFKTEWINCFKEINETEFDDNIYDIGGAVAVSTIAGEPVYRVRMNRRNYTKIMAIVRIGISKDAGTYSGRPITFTGIHATPSDA